MCPNGWPRRMPRRKSRHRAPVQGSAGVHRRKAAQCGLEGREHGATLNQVGSYHPEGVAYRPAACGVTARCSFCLPHGRKSHLDSKFQYRDTSVVSRVSKIRDAGKQRVASEFVSTHCKGELGFDFRLTGCGSKASSLVCRLESLRIPLKARICAKATGSKKAARRREVRLGFGTFDPASAQADLSKVR